MNTEQLKIENHRPEPVALLTEHVDVTHCTHEYLRNEVTALRTKITLLETRLANLPGMAAHENMISRMTNLHNQNEFLSIVLTKFIKAVQWPKITSKMVGEWTGMVRCLGLRGKKFTKFMENFEMALRDIEEYHASLVKNGAEVPHGNEG